MFGKQKTSLKLILFDSKTSYENIDPIRRKLDHIQHCWDMFYTFLLNTVKPVKRENIIESAFTGSCLYLLVCQTILLVSLSHPILSLNDSPRIRF